MISTFSYFVLLLVAIFVQVKCQTVELDDDEVPVATDNPEFVSKNATIKAELGGTVTLSCQVNKLGDSQIIWSKLEGNNWTVLRVGETPVLITRDNPKFSFTEQSTVLTIKDFEASNAGNYKCEIAVASANKPTIYLKVSLPEGQRGESESSGEKLIAGGLVTALSVVLTRIIRN